MGAIFGIPGAVLLLLAVFDFPLGGNAILELLFGQYRWFRTLVRFIVGALGVILILMGISAQ